MKVLSLNHVDQSGPAKIVQVRFGLADLVVHERDETTATVALPKIPPGSVVRGWTLHVIDGFTDGADPSLVGDTAAFVGDVQNTVRFSALRHSTDVSSPGWVCNTMLNRDDIPEQPALVTQELAMDILPESLVIDPVDPTQAVARVGLLQPGSLVRGFAVQVMEPFGWMEGEEDPQFVAIDTPTLTVGDPRVSPIRFSPATAVSIAEDAGGVRATLNPNDLNDEADPCVEVVTDVVAALAAEPGEDWNDVTMGAVRVMLWFDAPAGWPGMSPINPAVSEETQLVMTLLCPNGDWAEATTGDAVLTVFYDYMGPTE